jgi:hypothetical protein
MRFGIQQHVNKPHWLLRVARDNTACDLSFRVRQKSFLGAGSRYGKGYEDEQEAGDQSIH